MRYTCPFALPCVSIQHKWRGTLYRLRRKTPSLLSLSPYECHELSYTRLVSLSVSKCREGAYNMRWATKRASCFWHASQDSHYRQRFPSQDSHYRLALSPEIPESSLALMRVKTRIIARDSHCNRPHFPTIRTMVGNRNTTHALLPSTCCKPFSLHLLTERETRRV